MTVVKPYSIIIPVLNESLVINDLIDHLRGLPEAEKAEIILSDGPGGDTLMAVRDHAVHRLTSPAGRARQMNAGATIATGEVLIFLHADTRLPREAFSLIGQALENPDVVGGAFDLGIDSDRIVFRVIAIVASIRSRLTRIPYGDQAIFIRRSCFERLGGFPEIPLMEDVALMREIKREGGRIHIVADRVRASTRRWDKEGILYTTLRNWVLLGAYLAGVSPEKLIKYYRMGKSIYADGENGSRRKA